VTELINKLLDTPDEEISKTLGEIDVWKWPRSDLNAWIKVLNKFDAILADIIQEYEVDSLKLRQLSPEAKTKVSEILRFERLLLENSTNRKMFNSYDVRYCATFISSHLSDHVLMCSASTACCLQRILMS
jgi:E3 ubiquitin-protein ligase HUWE1